MKIGLICGSGFEDPEILKDQKEIQIDTQYGKASILSGNINNIETLIISRHGKTHQLSPLQVNNRANIKAFAQEKVTHIIATTACGSLKQEIKRGDFIILDQFIDFTRFRKNTFADSFEKKIVHTSMAKPFDEQLRQKIYKTAKELKLDVHGKGCVVTIEGPRFSTIAESKMFRIWRADVINMSTAPEAMLANEASIPYAAIAMSTDYDSWKEDEMPVTWKEIETVFKKNADNVKQLLIKIISNFKK